MKTRVTISSTRKVENVQAIMINSASYKGSDPFGGVFEVWDADECVFTDENGRLMVSVLCSEGPLYDEDHTLDLMLHDTIPHTVIGHYGEVASTIDITRI